VKYLFDADVISALMKNRISEKQRARLETIPADSRAISAISVMEVFHGAFRNPEPARFMKLFETLVLPRIEVIPFDDNVARLAGRVRAEREGSGRPIAPGDLQIAATALACGRILMTGNVRHFSDVPGLDVEKWLE
jgi:tRNA(fMet)-specific endonuclease VapC